MQIFDYKITDKRGIPARPAGMLVETATEFKSDIKLHAGGKSADAKRIFAVAGLGAKKGQTVTVEVEGSDEVEAARAVRDFLKENV